MTESRDEEKNSEVAQRLGASLDFLFNENDDTPPAIRGVMASFEDFKEEIQQHILKIGKDFDHPDLILKRVLWFEDKNGKLDEACDEAESAFRPYPPGKDGMVSWDSTNNPVLDVPCEHQLVVTDHFAGTNYDQVDDNELIIDDEDEEVVEVKPHSWKRKITQTISPWLVKKDERIVPVREPDDLLLTLNGLFSRTKHGWLVANLVRLKKRRGSMLIYADTYEYQRKDDQQYEFYIQYFGTASAYRKSLSAKLLSIGAVYLEIDSDGQIYLTRATMHRDDESLTSAEKLIDIRLPAKVVNENGKPSQIVLKPTGKYFQAKLLPLIQPGKRMLTKVDLRKSNSSEKAFRFQIDLELEGPLLVASSGDALLFQLDDMQERFS